MAADERCIHCTHFDQVHNYCISRKCWNPGANDYCPRDERSMKAQVEMARYGIRKTQLGYVVADRLYSSYQGAILAARHLSEQMTQERMIRIIEENRAQQRAVRELPQFTIRGDLHQMAEQKAFLEKQGFRVGQNDVYPGLFTREDYEKAIVAIWENEIEGWWNYGSQDFPKDYMRTLRPNLPKKHEQEKPETGKRDKYQAIKV